MKLSDFLKMPKSDDLLLTPKADNWLFKPLGFSKGYRGIDPDKIFKSSFIMFGIGLALIILNLLTTSIFMSISKNTGVLILISNLFSTILAVFFVIYSVYLFIYGIIKSGKKTNET